MAEWKYDLGITGKLLREAINTDVESIEACTETLNCLIRCLDWIDKHCTEDVKDYFYILRMDVEETIDNFKFLDEDDDEDYEIAEDDVNDLLDTFYNGCDVGRIWIGL